MNNPLIAINKVRILDGFSWIKSGFKDFCRVPVKISFISLLFFIILILIFAIGIFLHGSTIYALMVSIALSVIFPIILTSLSIIKYQLALHNSMLFKVVFKELSRGYNLYLIFIYALIILLISLGSTYLVNISPNNTITISYITEALYALFQILILIATPINVKIEGKIQPFQLLLFALKAFIVNLIPCILFLLFMIIVVAIAFIIAKLSALILGKVALIVYIIELLLIIIWVCLSAIRMANQLVIYSLNNIEF